MSLLPEDHYISSYQKGIRLKCAKSLILAVCPTTLLIIDLFSCSWIILDRLSILPFRFNAYVFSGPAMWSCRILRAGWGLGWGRGGHVFLTFECSHLVHVWTLASRLWAVSWLLDLKKATVLCWLLDVALQNTLPIIIICTAQLCMIGNDSPVCD